MKKLMPLALGAMLGAGAGSALAHDLMPAPALMSSQDGQLSLDAAFSVSLAGKKEARVDAAVSRFIKRLEVRSGLKFAKPLAASKADAKLVISWKNPGAAVQSVREDESYDLKVSSNQIKLSAPNPLGVMHGLETLLQLVKNEAGKSGIAAVTIHDEPRFPWRGILIDACRHWQAPEVIKRNLDGLAEAKMNVLHWHLSEDQGFRVESKKFPKLHQLGSDGNYYTQAQVKEIIAYARERGIRVVPEFDMPGHSTSWVVGYPELAAGPGPYTIERHWGVFDPTFDPTNEKVYEFLGGFIREMAGLFPDEYLHIGGDEVSGKQWNTSLRIQAFMNEHNMKTNGDLQAHFNARLSKIMTGAGKKMMGWDEIIHPDLPKNIVVQSWRDAKSLAEAAKNGCDVILSNGYYLDHMRTAAFHYATDPMSAGGDLSAQQKAHVLGGESCMWSEFTPSETIDSRIWPRNLAVAERLWSPADTKDVEDFYRRMEIESARLDELGLTHRSNYLPMLTRMVGAKGAESFKVLADTLEPAKFYSRGHARDYVSTMPMQRLVDAVRPESLTARKFQIAVDAWLKGAPKLGNVGDLKASLQIWKDNHKTLGPILKNAPLAQEAYPQSADLSAAAQMGLEALDYLSAGKQAPAEWLNGAKKVLARAQIQRAEVEIAVVPSISSLVLTAGQWNKLLALKAPARMKLLAEQIESIRKGEDD